MNCCGNKRKEWLNESQTSTHPDTVENESITANAEKSDKIFEFTGTSSLKITGLVSGNSYFFRFKGDKLKVKYIDSFALMAERDLKIIR
jgi:hypothetical protein